MDEDIKMDEKNPDRDTSVKEKPKKKKADVLYRLYKKESHKDNKCILTGITEQELAQFNSGEIITVSNEQIKIIGCKVDDEDNITYLPYRWLGVE